MPVDWGRGYYGALDHGMRPSLHIAALACSICGGSASGTELIRPTNEISEMRVVVKRLSTIELVNLQRRYGVRVDLRDGRQGRHGFTIVKRNLETGAFTCEIYLPNDKRPRTVDDEATLSVGHEFLHCLLGEYHE
jgi:hypothetical protein